MCVCVCVCVCVSVSVCACVHADDSSNYMSTQFAQAAQQLANVPSCHLCVPVASGGDPTFGFKVRFTGEEVMGTSKL